MSKLLSEQELRDALRDVVTRNGMSVRIPELLEDELDKLMALVQAQKIAHGDMVIGDSIQCDGTCDDGAHEGQNSLITWQRQRNHVV